MQDILDQEKVWVTKASERFEAIAGVLIAVFAALMAISDLIGNNVEDDRKYAEIQHAEMFSWYQSKSVKQSLQESHLETLQLMSKLLKLDKNDTTISYVKAEIKRYKKEKKELLEGSSQLDKKDWAQEKDGKMGEIIGVKEWEKKAAFYNIAESKFDISALFFQISLVLGAICIVFYDNPRLQRAFVLLMVIIGILGSGFAVYGYRLYIG
jgi:hypothetical protein